MSNPAWATNNGQPIRPSHPEDTTPAPFNVNEIRDFLKQALISTASQEGKHLIYKPNGAQANNTTRTTNSAWSSSSPKAGAMANSKDFSLELRKQVTAMRQGDHRAGG